MNIIDIKDNLHDKRILSVIAQSQYMPTEEKLNTLAYQYKFNPAISAFACVDTESVCGTIILKHTKDNEFEILGIATDLSRRMQGIGTRLISYAVSTLDCKLITAETDDDAVDFYRKYGFQIESLGEKYPGTVRYFCTLKLP